MLNHWLVGNDPGVMDIDRKGLIEEEASAATPFTTATDE